MNHDALRRIITQTDKNRSRYYEFLSGQKWGAKENYDLCINTSSADTEKLLQCVISLLLSVDGHGIAAGRLREAAYAAKAPDKGAFPNAAKAHPISSAACICEGSGMRFWWSVTG